MQETNEDKTYDTERQIGKVFPRSAQTRHDSRTRLGFLSMYLLSQTVVTTKLVLAIPFRRQNDRVVATRILLNLHHLCRGNLLSTITSLDSKNVSQTTVYRHWGVSSVSVHELSPFPHSSCNGTILHNPMSQSSVQIPHHELLSSEKHHPGHIYFPDVTTHQYSPLSTKFEARSFASLTSSAKWDRNEITKCPWWLDNGAAQYTHLQRTILERWQYIDMHHPQLQAVLRRERWMLNYWVYYRSECYRGSPRSHF